AAAVSLEVAAGVIAGAAVLPVLRRRLLASSRSGLARTSGSSRTEPMPATVALATDRNRAATCSPSGALTGTRVAAGVPDALQHFGITRHPADLVRLAC